MIEVILSLILIGLTFYIYNKNEKQWKYIRNIPGPNPNFFIGNALQIGATPEEYLINLLKWWRQFDCNIYKFWIAHQPYVVITDPKDVEAVLTSTTLLEKGDVYKMLHTWLGEGLLTSTGQKWFKHRKMITPTFHFKVLVDFFDVFVKNSNNFIEKLSIKANTDEIFDIQELFHYCTLDVICETAMGTEINAINNHDSKVVLAFQHMCYVMQQRFFSPIKRNDFLFKFTKEYTLREEAFGILKTFMMNVIDKRRAALAEQLKSENNDNKNTDEFHRRKQVFLDTLLTAQIDGKPLTNQEIFEEVSTFMFEGHDTTSSGVSFCTFLLSRHPNIQKKVFDEQKQIFGNDMKRNPTYQDMQDMKYLEIVIKESQRFYPSVPMIARYTNNNLDLCGKCIPTGSTIVVFILAMNYDGKYFKDPLKFDPERFNIDNSTGRNPYEYVPFSAGPRNCIGQKFAMLEMKSIISNIVRNFEVLPPNIDCVRKDNYEKIVLNNKYDPILASVLTLKSENGIQVKLKTRNLE